MDLLVIAFVFAIGVAVWYMIFYFRYEHREVVDEMRNRIESNLHDMQAMKNDLVEYTEQNKILKEKAHDLLVKNDDLSKIVAEMSRYYQYLKNAHEKARDLADFLKVFEEADSHHNKYADTQYWQVSHQSSKMIEKIQEKITLDPTTTTNSSFAHTHIGEANLPSQTKKIF
jgi:hypothetical protein